MHKGVTLFRVEVKNNRFLVRKKCSCIFTKKPNERERAKLVPIEASYPFEVVSVDFLHLDTCKGGYEYVLVVCDHFTRFAQAYATKRKSARAAAQVLFNKFILNYGFPARIHHDRGGEWNNHLFNQLHKLANIKASNTTPYHPMGDPVVERYNRTLINMLKSIPENEKKRWVDHLPKLCFAYNSTVHKATGFSPFFLLFGRPSRLRIDGAFPSFGETGPSGEMTSYTQFAADWRKRMDEAFQLANQRSDKSKHYHKSVYDGKAKSVEISVGDRVLVQNNRPVGTGKLSTFWEPDVHVVVKKRGELPVYELRKYGAPTSKIRVLHRNLLKVVNELSPPEPETSAVKGKGSPPANPGKKGPVVSKKAQKSVLLNPSAEEFEPAQCQPGKGLSPDDVSSPDNVCVLDREVGVLPGEASAGSDDDDGYFIAVSTPPVKYLKPGLPGAPPCCSSCSSCCSYCSSCSSCSSSSSSCGNSSCGNSSCC